MFKLKHYIILIFSLFFICLLIPANYYAGEKEIALEIEKDYSACTFRLECFETGDYTVEVISPSGQHFPCRNIENTTEYNCTIDNVKKGIWYISISDPMKAEIGKVSVSVVAATPESGKVDDDVSVGREIAGLSIYFKNQTLMATWTDNDCGAVSFRIVDLDTSKQIANDKSNEKSYSCEIPKGVKNISVEIVASRNNGIQGASSTYNLTVPDKANADVIYPTNTYTNSNTLTVDVVLREPYAIMVEDNGVCVFKKETLAAGEYSFGIPLNNEGENVIAFFLIDSDGNMRSCDEVFIRDIVSPILTLKSEYDGLIVKEDSITIEGSIINYDSFTLNGNEIEVATDGTFSYNCSLHDGENKLILLATDLAGNETVYNITITLETKTKSIVPILLIPVAIFVFVVYVIKTLKKAGTSPKKTVVSENTKQILKETEDINKREENIYTGAEECSEKEEILNTQEATKTNNVSNISKKKNIKRVKYKDAIIQSIVLVISVFVIFQFVLLSGTVVSGSMEPTLMTGDWVIYNRLAYLKNEPKAGDIISFTHNGEDYCKRIIGVAGDTILFADGYVYVNGEKLEETYFDADTETNCTKEFTVPDDTVFVLGDNREFSIDSRHWEDPYISISDINGKYLFSLPLGER